MFIFVVVSLADFIWELEGKHVEWLDEQRKTWSWLYDQKESKVNAYQEGRFTTTKRSMQDKLGQYETAILGALCGRTERVSVTRIKKGIPP